MTPRLVLPRAGIGVGLYDGTADAVDRCCHVLGTHEPSAENHGRYTEFFAVYSDAQRQLAEINHRLHDITVAPQTARSSALLVDHFDRIAGIGCGADH